MKEKKRTAPLIKTMLQSFQLMMDARLVRYLIVMIVWLIFGMTSGLGSLLNRNFLNAASGLLSGDGGMLRTALLWLGLWGVLTLSSDLVDAIWDRKYMDMNVKLRAFVQEKILKQVANVRMSYFDDREAQKKIRNVKGEFPNRISSVVYCAIDSSRMIVTGITAIAVLMGENPWITLIVILSVIPVVIISRIYTEERYWQEQGRSFDSQMQRYVGLLLTKQKYMKEMRFYQLYDYMEAKNERLKRKKAKEQIALDRKLFFSILFADVFTYAGMALSLLLISVDIFHGKAGIGSFVLVYQTVLSLQNALRFLFNQMDFIAEQGHYLADYHEVMGYETEDVQSVEMDESMPLTIVFDHVSFSYPGSDREVLHDVNVTIQKGEKIAIVGENGSGKTTFVSLLCGLYAPTKGRILINGVEASKCLRFLRSKISCTTQEFMHLHGSVADNVRIGDYERPHTREELREALRKADVLQVVDELPKKEDTNLGNLLPDSTDLSGGQWQKLAMARNVIKQEADLMILDEPTAALDPLAETRLYEDFSELTKDKGVVLISHRLGATRVSQRVLVFREGQIVEEGSHGALLQAGGYYAQMYQAQAQWYEG